VAGAAEPAGRRDAVKHRREQIMMSVWIYLAAMIVGCIGAFADLPVFVVAALGLCITHGMMLTVRVVSAQRLHDYLAAMADDTNTADPALISDRDLDYFVMLCKACPPGPWDVEETVDTWVLFSAPAGEGLATVQILKAPKHGTPYAEFWPDQPTGELIRVCRTIIPTLVAEIRRERAAMARAMAGYPQLPDPAAQG
jgi:hypothetical protein